MMMMMMMMNEEGHQPNLYSSSSPPKRSSPSPICILTLGPAPNLCAPPRSWTSNLRVGCLTPSALQVRVNQSRVIEKPPPLIMDHPRPFFFGTFHIHTHTLTHTHSHTHIHLTDSPLPITMLRHSLINQTRSSTRPLTPIIRSFHSTPLSASQRAREQKSLRDRIGGWARRSSHLPFPHVTYHSPLALRRCSMGYHHYLR